MALRHVLGHGRMTALTIGASVTGNALVPAEDLDRALAGADVEEFAEVGERDAVEVSLHRDVVVDAGARLLPLGITVRLHGKRRERRTVDLLEESAARVLELLERATVEFLDELPDGQVELVQGEEAPVA